MCKLRVSVKRSFELAVPALCGLTLGALLSTCGLHVDAPKQERQASTARTCRSFEQLSPHFLEAIRTGKIEPLRQFILDLNVPDRPGDVPRVNDVLRGVFVGLGKLANKPGEGGAPQGEYCLPLASQPPLTTANELCEIRRSLEVLVHQGKAIDAIDLLKPQLSTLIGYLTGLGTDCRGRPRTPAGQSRPNSHYEVASIFSRMCAQTAQCQLSNGLDLIIAFSDFAATPQGKLAVDHVNALASRSSVSSFLDPTRLTEDQFVAIANALIPIVQAADASALEQAFANVPGLPQNVRDDLRPLIEDLKVLLGKPELIQPIRLALECFKVEDPQRHLARMIYRILVGEQCTEFGLTKLTAVLQNLQAIDQRGSLLFVANRVAKVVREDETALDSAAAVCQFSLSTAPAADGGISNAEKLLPAAYDLIQQGIIDETICTTDTLLFGCDGGAQPACR